MYTDRSAVIQLDAAVLPRPEFPAYLDGSGRRVPRTATPLPYGPPGNPSLAGNVTFSRPDPGKQHVVDLDVGG